MRHGSVTVTERFYASASMPKELLDYWKSPSV
jgi:hypothetical protein